MHQVVRDGYGAESTYVVLLLFLPRMGMMDFLLLKRTQRCLSKMVQLFAFKDFRVRNDEVWLYFACAYIFPGALGLGAKYTVSFYDLKGNLFD